ncbi:MAG: cell division topological specificity factor MinE [Anaerolineae bacterium]|nr:cell division topological specificity factor MinE [Anaerolineae bacterium]
MFRKKSTSAGSAKDRLQLVLIQDRTNLSALDLDQLKNEILEVLARYVDIDRRAVNISMEQDGREQRLRADIPLKAATRANRR